MKPVFTILLTLSLTIISYSQSDVEILADWMTGSFTSEEQAKADTNYLNIELEMVEIWKARPDGPWIYVEQAAAEFKDKPYRQRVYQLKKRNDGKIESVVYTIPDPLRFAGDYKKEIPLLKLTPDSLTIREGCKVVLYREDAGHFTGNTAGKNCESNLRGASYAASEVTIYENRIISWDRGFDEENKQVWGAVNVGYVFMKKSVELPRVYPEQ
jgi:hypothetical protein